MKYGIWVSLAVITFSVAACSKDVPDDNKLHYPRAHAGDDQALVVPYNTIELNGSLSADPTRGNLQYQWRQVSGPAPSIIANSTDPLTVITGLVEGKYVFELEVTNNAALKARDTVNISIINDMNYSYNFKERWWNTCSLNIPDFNYYIPANKTIKVYLGFRSQRNEPPRTWNIVSDDPAGHPYFYKIRNGEFILYNKISDCWLIDNADVFVKWN